MVGLQRVWCLLIVYKNCCYEFFVYMYLYTFLIYLYMDHFEYIGIYVLGDIYIYIVSLWY